MVVVVVRVAVVVVVEEVVLVVVEVLVVVVVAVAVVDCWVFNLCLFPFLSLYFHLLPLFFAE